VRTYLFDLDGTLTDARPGLHASFRAALAALGVGALSDTQLDRFLGTPLPEMFRSLNPGVSAVDIERGIQAFRATYESEGVFRNDLYPGIPEMLAALEERRLAAWVVTSKPEHYAVQVVQHLGIARHFAGIIGAGLSETDTKTTLIARAIARTGIRGEDALMLGDRYYDVVGALQNAVVPIGALWGYGSRDELSDAGCTLFVETPQQFTRQFIAATKAVPVPGRAGRR